MDGPAVAVGEGVGLAEREECGEEGFGKGERLRKRD